MEKFKQTFRTIQYLVQNFDLGSSFFLYLIIYMFLWLLYILYNESELKAKFP